MDLGVARSLAGAPDGSGGGSAFFRTDYGLTFWGAWGMVTETDYIIPSSNPIGEDQHFRYWNDHGTLIARPKVMDLAKSSRPKFTAWIDSSEPIKELNPEIINKIMSKNK